MRIVKIIISFVLILSLPLIISMVTNEVPVVAEGTKTISNIGVTADQELRGVWVATVSNINYPSDPSVDPEVLKNEAISILDNAKSYGMNAIFLQVRPTADSLYKSKYFPWSKYLTGTQGTAPGNDFDPLAFWVTEAHKRGMELHAWINPYRVTKQESGEPSPDTSTLALNNPARVNPTWVIKYSDGNYYFDPGIPEVRKLVIDGALEIVENYDIDGIHFDDYFYPGTDLKDDSSFSTYGRAYSDKNEWRRNNVNVLISDLYKAIKATGKNIDFGISPSGIWANKSRNPLGSDTKGSESYYEHYADTLKWVKEGLIDYIAPQIYWNIGYSIADYSKLLNWWSNAVSGTKVKLYIGQAAYRTGNSSTTSAWYGIAEIDRQLRLNATLPNVKGSVFYNYNSLSGNPALSSAIKAYYEQKDGAVVKTHVNVSRPADNTETSYSNYYLSGTSDPAKPLLLNGKPIESRSSLGYFGVLAPLQKGANVFTISQEGTYTTRVIYKSTSSSSSTKMTTIEIPSSSAFPQDQEYRTAGEKITLSCKAPAGSKVTVKLGGKTYTMKTTSKASSTGAYAATYTYAYTVPKYTGTPRNIDLGAPVYTMTYKGIVKTRKAPAKVGVIMKNSPYYALVEKDVIDTYKTASSSDGCAYELYKGMKDYITGMTGDFTRLSSGQWVRKTNITAVSSTLRLLPSVKSAKYIKGDVWDKLVVDTSSPSAAFASFDGTTMKLTISPLTKTSLPVLPDNSLFSSVKVSQGDNIAYYTLTKKAGQKIEGYYVEKSDTGIVLYVKRHITATPGMQALSGIKIMIDPGHGGDERGAIGPLGKLYAEKDINLKSALKLREELQKLGAEVIMTRTGDTTISLVDRLAASRKAKPDMFISIHANSTEENADISKIFGFSVHHREAIAKELSDDISSSVISDLGRKDRDVNINNFYVVRGTWAPSLLIESGFVPNPYEFEWLTNETAQTSLAASLAKAIATYFAN
jgi:Uncharacterized protein conserved in bacteria